MSGQEAEVVPWERVGTQTDILGECPLWSVRDQALIWVDIRQPAIRRFAIADNALTTWPMPDMVGAIALCADHRLLVALGDRIAFFDPDTSAFETVARTPAHVDGHRFNDGRCDPRGRFWISTMHNVTRGPEGVLYRLDAGGLVPTLTGIRIPNSLCWSPDGRTMYFADSLDYAIHAYRYDPDSGTFGEKRPFARLAEPAFPDGSAVDAEGCLWNAEFNGGRVVRYDPDGRVVRTIATPVDRPTCCAFGGPDLDILYVTTTCQNMSAEQRAASPLAGALLAMEPGVKGIPEPIFAPPRQPA